MRKLPFILLLAAGVFFLAPNAGHAAMAGTSQNPDVTIVDRDGGLLKPVHYSHRWGWHCGRRGFGHHHRERCGWGPGPRWWLGSGWRRGHPGWRGRRGCRVTPWGEVYCRF